MALLLCSVDLPARALITNMKQWNGINGCLYCEDRGVTIGGDHLHRYWPYQPSSTSRSRASLLSNAEMAVITGNAVNSLLPICLRIISSVYYVGMWCQRAYCIGPSYCF